MFIFRYRLIDLLEVIGDYDAQTSMIEIIFRVFAAQVVGNKDIIPKKTRLNYLFTQNIKADTFDEDIRVFLNAFNKETNGVYSVPCTRVAFGSSRRCVPPMDMDIIWVDFNPKPKTLTWFCDFASHLTVPRDDEDRWNLITLFEQDVRSVEVKRNKEGTMILEIISKEPCLSEFSEAQQFFDKAGKKLNIHIQDSFKDSKLVSTILPTMFGYKFKHRGSMGRETKSVYRPLKILVSRSPSATNTSVTGSTKSRDVTVDSNQTLNKSAISVPSTNLKMDLDENSSALSEDTNVSLEDVESHSLSKYQISKRVDTFIGKRKTQMVSVIMRHNSEQFSATETELPVSPKTVNNTTLQEHVVTSSQRDNSIDGYNKRLENNVEANRSEKFSQTNSSSSLMFETAEDHYPSNIKVVTAEIHQHAEDIKSKTKIIPELYKEKPPTKYSRLLDRIENLSGDDTISPTYRDKLQTVNAQKPKYLNEVPSKHTIDSNDVFANITQELTNLETDIRKVIKISRLDCHMEPALQTSLSSQHKKYSNIYTSHPVHDNESTLSNNIDLKSKQPKIFKEIVLDKSNYIKESEHPKVNKKPKISIVKSSNEKPESSIKKEDDNLNKEKEKIEEVNEENVRSVSVWKKTTIKPENKVTDKSKIQDEIKSTPAPEVIGADILPICEQHENRNRNIPIKNKKKLAKKGGKRKKMLQGNEKSKNEDKLLRISESKTLQKSKESTEMSKPQDESSLGIVQQKSIPENNSVTLEPIGCQQKLTLCLSKITSQTKSADENSEANIAENILDDLIDLTEAIEQELNEKNCETIVAAISADKSIDIKPTCDAVQQSQGLTLTLNDNNDNQERAVENIDLISLTPYSYSNATGVQQEKKLQSSDINNLDIAEAQQFQVAHKTLTLSTQESELDIKLIHKNNSSKKLIITVPQKEIHEVDTKSESAQCNIDIQLHQKYVTQKELVIHMTKEDMDNADRYLELLQRDSLLNALSNVGRKAILSEERNINDDSIQSSFPCEDNISNDDDLNIYQLCTQERSVQGDIIAFCNKTQELNQLQIGLNKSGNVTVKSNVKNNEAQIMNVNSEIGDLCDTQNVKELFEEVLRNTPSESQPSPTDCLDVEVTNKSKDISTRTKEDLEDDQQVASGSSSPKRTTIPIGKKPHSPVSKLESNNFESRNLDKEEEDAQRLKSNNNQTTMLETTMFSKSSARHKRKLYVPGDLTYLDDIGEFEGNDTLVKEKHIDSSPSKHKSLLENQNASTVVKTIKEKHDPICDTKSKTPTKKTRSPIKSKTTSYTDKKPITSPSKHEILLENQYASTVVKTIKEKHDPICDTKSKTPTKKTRSPIKSKTTSYTDNKPITKQKVIVVADKKSDSVRKSRGPKVTYRESTNAMYYYITKPGNNDRVMRRVPKFGIPFDIDEQIDIVCKELFGKECDNQSHSIGKKEITKAQDKKKKLANSGLENKKLKTLIKGNRAKRSPNIAHISKNLTIRDLPRCLPGDDFDNAFETTTMGLFEKGILSKACPITPPLQKEAKNHCATLDKIISPLVQTETPKSRIRLFSNGNTESPLPDLTIERGNKRKPETPEEERIVVPKKKKALIKVISNIVIQPATGESTLETAVRPIVKSKTKSDQQNKRKHSSTLTEHLSSYSRDEIESWIDTGRIFSSTKY